jgi:hypothetical protein
MNTHEQRLVLALADAIVSTVHECPDGAPGGVLFAALMPYLSLHQFEAVMSALVFAERVRRVGHLYFPA